LYDEIMNALRILFAAAVFLAATNCVFSCVLNAPAGSSANAGVPPCHRHPGAPHQSGDAQPCPHQLVGTPAPCVTAVYTDTTGAVVVKAATQLAAIANPPAAPVTPPAVADPQLPAVLRI